MKFMDVLHLLLANYSSFPVFTATSTHTLRLSKETEFFKTGVLRFDLTGIT